MLALQSSSSSNVRRVSARQPPSAWGSIAGHSTTSLSKQRSISSSDSLPLSPPSSQSHAQAKPRSSSSSSSHYRLEPQDLELQDLAALRESFFAAPAQSTSHTSLLPTPSLKQANAKSPAPPPTGSTTKESRKKEEEKPAADEVDPKEPLDPHLRTIFLLAKAVLRSPQVVSDMLNGAPTVGQPSGTAVSPVVPPATEAPPPVTALVRTKRIHGLMELLSAAEHINTSGRLREKGLTRDADPRHLYASEFFEIAYGRWKDVLAGTAKNDAKAASRPATGSVQPPRRASEDTTSSGSHSAGNISASKTSPPTSVDEHSPSLAVPQSNSVTFPGGSESVPLPEASKLETVSEEDATHDLLAKLCAAALRANLPSSALRHATTALESSPYAIRARLFAAAACLDLGRLADAQKHLSQLPPDLTDVSFKPKVGRTKDGRTFDKSMPDWVRVRMGNERRRLARLIGERDAVYNPDPDAASNPDSEPAPVVPIPRFAAAFDTVEWVLSPTTDHAMSFALGLIKLTGRGYEVTRAVTKGEVLCVVPPLTPCATVYAPFDPSTLAKTKARIKPPRIVIRAGRRVVEPEPAGAAAPVPTSPASDPFQQELPLARLANALRALARGNPDLGSALVWAAQRLAQGKTGVSRAVTQLGLSQDRAGVLALAQSRAVRLGKDVAQHAVTTGVVDAYKIKELAKPLEAIDGALGVFFPLLSMASAPSPPPPTEHVEPQTDAEGGQPQPSLLGYASAQASFSGVTLVLRAVRDMACGEMVSVDFSRTCGLDAAT